MVIIIYSTAVCPKSRKLKEYLQANGFEFETRDMQDWLPFLRAQNVTTINAPVFQVGDKFYIHADIFIGNQLNESFIQKLINNQPSD
jgi:glutaredoxin